MIEDSSLHELRWETDGSAYSLDPHKNYEPLGTWIAYNVYETLFTILGTVLILLPTSLCLQIVSLFLLTG